MNDPDLLHDIDMAPEFGERRLSPQQKKALAYREDHRVWAKYPHVERHSWPKRKALRNQTYRRQVTRSLAPARGVVDGDIADFSPVMPLRRLSKWRNRHGAMPLGKWVEERERKRLALTGRKILGNFHRERHRQRLGPFLESMIQGRSEHSRVLARSFALLLNHPPMHPRQWHQLLGDEAAIDLFAWTGALDALFAEQPDLEARLRAWIADLTGSDLGGEAVDQRGDVLV